MDCIQNGALLAASLTHTRAMNHHALHPAITRARAHAHTLSRSFALPVGLARADLRWQHAAYASPRSSSSSMIAECVSSGKIVAAFLSASFRW